jgi:hypothetical protein
MQTYEELVELARICVRNARTTTDNEVAAELWKMAREYKEKAARLNGGRVPSLGEDDNGDTPND